MGWTEKQIETLRTMWASGQSASLIAHALGNNISRNAVIGKAHRLKLMTRATTSAKTSRDRTRINREVRNQSRVSGTVAAQRDVAQNSNNKRSSGSGKAAYEQRHAAPNANAVERAMESLRAVQGIVASKVGENQCRWPIGDPRSPDFRFCGCPAHDGLPYCAEHARVAFQTVSRRPRLDLDGGRYGARQFKEG